MHALVVVNYLLRHSMNKYQKALKKRYDEGDELARDLLIDSMVEQLLEPVIPLLVVRVRVLMETVFEETKRRYEVKDDN
jgi:hypothetical protein